MGYLKSDNTCIALYCQKRVEPGHDKSGLHLIDEVLARESREPKGPKVYEWVEFCGICSYESDLRFPRELTARRAQAWVRSGWMRCPTCRSSHVGLRQIEYGQGGSPMVAQQEMRMAS